MPAQQINPLPGAVQQQGGQVLQRLHGGASVARTRPSTCADRFIRKTGSDTNGGSSAAITPDSQGTDGVTNGTATFTAATGTFTQADVNKLVMITTKARYRIVAVGSATSITLSGSPSAGSSLTWKMGGAVATIKSLLESATSPAGTILGGDSIYIGAGTYREANITTSLSPTFELQMNGDVTGQYTGDAGMVQWSAWLVNDKTLNAQTIITLASKSNYTFQDICFVGSTSFAILTTGTTDNLTFRRCSFLSVPGAGHMFLTVAYQLFSNIRVENCYFNPAGGSSTFTITLITGIGGHYDAGVFITNCIFAGGNGAQVTVNASGALAGRGGGVRVSRCTFYGNGTGVTTAANNSNGFPVGVTGCLFFGMATGLNAASVGQIVEQQNYIGAFTTRTNVAVGPGSTPGADSGTATAWAPLVHFGQEVLWGGMPRQFGEPMVNSPFLGFGVDQGGFDALGRPRPAGSYSTAAASSAVGALQRGNTAVADATPIGGGTTPIQITGPGFEDFYVPVPARAITVSCSVRFTGSPARLEVLANPMIGVRGQSVVAPGLPNVVQTITLGAFTPTAAGSMVTVRIYNPDPGGASVLEVDDFLVTG